MRLADLQARDGREGDLMFLVQCRQCGMTAFAECAPGCDQVDGAHLAGCRMGDLDALITCGCCPQDHDHAAAANNCPGGHGACKSGGVKCTVVTPAGQKCPGGHCAFEDPDCSVCRPLVITAPPGSNVMYPAGG